MVVRLSALSHQPPLPPRKYTWYSFLLEAESTPGPWCDRKDYVTGKFQWHHRESNLRPAGLWLSALTTTSPGAPNITHRLTEIILNAWDNDRYIACVYCDMTKACDCVNHKLLFKKLQFNGVKGILLDWFKSYLYIRQQRVELKFSDMCNYLQLGKL